MGRSEPDIKSCGFLLVREQPEKSFLLMRHPDRWDLPKGHCDQGETELETALRELHEETGISAADIEIDSGFRFSHVYKVQLKRNGRKPQKKELVVFLARLVRVVDPVLTEHDDFDWLPWNPPHRIQERTIDPLLAAVEQWWNDPQPSANETRSSTRRIYTGYGDDGKTQLLGGQTTRKSDSRVEMCGQLDELNAAIGVVLGHPVNSSVARQLVAVQSLLFEIGACIAAMGSKRMAGLTEIGAGDIRNLERSIDEIQSSLPPLTNFILPGGCPAAASLHMARAICRRVERCLVRLMDEFRDKSCSVDAEQRLLVYLNRLGDWLFVTSRRVNYDSNSDETIWTSRRTESEQNREEPNRPKSGK